MIKINPATEHDRMYCNVCLRRTFEEGELIEFEFSKNGNGGTIMVMCKNCRKELKDRLMHIVEKDEKKGEGHG